MHATVISNVYVQQIKITGAFNHIGLESSWREISKPMKWRKEKMINRDLIYLLKAFPR